MGNFFENIYMRSTMTATSRVLAILTASLLTVNCATRTNVNFLLERGRTDFRSARLSDKDFSVRYDRHKILIVLPGKDKKYAVPLANAVCNELVKNFSTHEAQLLVTFLTAAYPLDGKDTSGLIDAVN